MPDQTKEIAWHPWSGCSPISPSCLNCYRVPEDGDMVRKTARGPIFNGKLTFNEAQIDLPRKTPGSHLFQVCPHGDAFHENAPDAWLDQVFDMMESEDRHTFAVVTKRGERMLSYMKTRYGERLAPAHIFLGVLAERQYEADARIAALIAAPAASKYAIFYCLMGPIDIFAIPGADAYQLGKLKAVQIASDGWAKESIEDEWADKVAADFQRLGITASRHVLADDIATRGY